MQSLSSYRKPVSNKSFGIELECITGSGVYEKRYTHDGFFYITTDGSIRGHEWDKTGIEFVSQPLPFNWMLKELTKLGKKYEWEVNHTCGIHVHVSKVWCTWKKAAAIYKFLQHFYSNEPALYCLVFGRAPTNYCDFRGDLGCTRYLAINTQNDKTTEFRMFRSGDVEWAKRCVKMVNFLVTNCYNLSIDNVLAAFDMFSE